MKTNYLFPNRYKKTGWVLFIIGILLGVVYILGTVFMDFETDISIFDLKVFAIAVNRFAGDTSYFTVIRNEVFDEIACLLIVVGALLVAFSKEKSEDEFISKIRLESLVWATYVNYVILIVSIIFVYEMIFFWVLIFNMFTLLIFFLIRYNWVLYKTKNQVKDEE
ncbi:MAG: hypothetical protein JXR50_01775 [Prolixibacteraceae bacterium]|nr:hypothetical protein [Prolixibacteraceae bacterium]MBN2648450.1 hypothetical protein [Prolixibacteraceae bacterium]